MRTLLALAVDIGISDVIVTGDFNLNMLNVRMSRKIESLCIQFFFHQSIDEPTQFTEDTLSLIDIVLVNNKDHLLLSGVGDPFLNQELQYHCPVYGILKPKFKTFPKTCVVLRSGNSNLLRESAHLGLGVSSR